MPYVYAIVRDDDSNDLKIIQEYIYNVPCSDEKLCNFYNYATSLSDAYCSCLPAISKKNLYYRANREAAYAMQKAIEKVKTKNLVAHSHRYGGFTHFDWNFGEDVTFHIYTNFGYGGVSDFNSTFKYKDIILAPYSYYVKYRNSDYASVVRCTHQYRLDYDEWHQVMKDCLDFYNAVVNGTEHYIFDWINKQLLTMVSGLEEFIHCDSYSFYDEKWNCRVSKKTTVTADDFWIIKSTKIANSLEFVENIRILPTQINTQGYINKLLNICNEFKPYLYDKIDDTQLRVNVVKQKLEELKHSGDYALYSKLYEKYYWKKKWYHSNNQFKMIRFLMLLLKKLVPIYELKDIKRRIKELELLIKKVDEASSKLSSLESFLSTLEKNGENLNMYINKYI